MSTAKISADCLAALGKYDTPTICNVVELFDVQPRSAGFMDDSILISPEIATTQITEG